MIKNKIIVSVFLVAYNLLALGMDGQNSLGTEIDADILSVICPKAMGCQLAKEMRLRYVQDVLDQKKPATEQFHIIHDGISVSKLWYLVNIAKDEVENLKIRQEVKMLAALIPFPCKYENGDIIGMEKHPKSGNMYIPFYKSPAYQNAVEVIQPFNSTLGLLHAHAIVQTGKKLNLVRLYKKSLKK